MKRRKRRMLFFPVGLIALCIFPIVGFLKIAEEYRIKTASEHAMEVSWPCSKKNCFSEKYSIDYIKKQRHFIAFILTGDSLKNWDVLNHARLCLNRIKKNNDTINGVRIVFNDCNVYQEFITAIDYCGEKFPAIYMACNNDILAMYAPIDTSYYPKEKLDALRRQGKFNY